MDGDQQAAKITKCALRFEGKAAYSDLEIRLKYGVELPLGMR
jgi:hypothetical protein